ncbi:hypothetical protein RJ640_007950 [Escallonia rubra]|uniref:Uncharacterized protein n=1 Tax=Escallonia rubra TaxID=112253 RepID=A0AA88QX01_9ASTE|nr:hypothetical protein RJ640_007950 [Escallonia rubra]
MNLQIPNNELDDILDHDLNQFDNLPPIDVLLAQLEQMPMDDIMDIDIEQISDENTTDDDTEAEEIIVSDDFDDEASSKNGSAGVSSEFTNPVSLTVMEDHAPIGATDDDDKISDTILDGNLLLIANDLEATLQSPLTNTSTGWLEGSKCPDQIQFLHLLVKIHSFLQISSLISQVAKWELLCPSSNQRIFSITQSLDWAPPNTRSAIFHAKGQPTANFNWARSLLSSLSDYGLQLVLLNLKNAQPAPCSPHDHRPPPKPTCINQTH